MIYEFLKDRHGHRKGVVCAIGRGQIGWSLCNERGYNGEKGDRFDTKRALEIAEGRAKEYGNRERYEIHGPLTDSNGWYTFTNIITGKHKKVPNSLVKLFKKTLERSERYYK